MRSKLRGETQAQLRRGNQSEKSNQLRDRARAVSAVQGSRRSSPPSAFSTCSRSGREVASERAKGAGTAQADSAALEEPPAGLPPFRMSRGTEPLTRASRATSDAA